MEETKKRSVEKLPFFFKELIKICQDLSKGEVEELEFVLSQNLWNNAFITLKNIPLYSKTLSDGNFMSWASYCHLNLISQ